jgi:hypothetical protein
MQLPPRRITVVMSFVWRRGQVSMSKIKRRRQTLEGVSEREVQSLGILAEQREI